MIYFIIKMIYLKIVFTVPKRVTNDFWGSKIVNPAGFRKTKSSQPNLESRIKAAFAFDCIKT